MGTGGGPRRPQPTRARPGGLCPPRVSFGLCFSSVCLFPKIKNLYIPPEPIDLRIMEKSPVFFSCCFLTDLIHHGHFKLLQGQVLRERHQPIFAGGDATPSSYQMREGVLHIRDVQGPKGLDLLKLGLKLWSRKFSGARGWWNVDSMPITS